MTILPEYNLDACFCLVQDERMRLSEQLAAAREELRKAEQANRARAETQSQVCVVAEMHRHLARDACVW
jgi:hypothetical protein